MTRGSFLLGQPSPTYPRGRVHAIVCISTVWRSSRSFATSFFVIASLPLPARCSPPASSRTPAHPAPPARSPRRPASRSSLRTPLLVRHPELAQHHPHLPHV